MMYDVYMTSAQLAEKVEKRLRKLDIDQMIKDMPFIGEDRMPYVRDEWKHPYRYHQWLYCLMKEVRPKIVLELGGHMGTSAAAMLGGLPKTSKLYSVELETNWCKGVRDDPRFIGLKGDDTDLKTYPGNLKFEDVDVWFVDSSHVYEHVFKQCELFGRYWTKGKIVVFDDIKDPDEVALEFGESMNGFGVHKVWQALQRDKVELPEMHYSGFGFFVA